MSIDVTDVAAGMPRSSELKGKVVLFDDRLNVMINISGDQVGSLHSSQLPYKPGVTTATVKPRSIAYRIIETSRSSF